MSLTENHTIAELLYENGKLSAELEAERFMLELITSLSSTELIDDGINNVLCKVGEYTCADRAYVFEINEDYTTTNNYRICKITYIQITGARGRRTGRRYASEV